MIDVYVVSQRAHERLITFEHAFELRFDLVQLLALQTRRHVDVDGVVDLAVNETAASFTSDMTAGGRRMPLSQAPIGFTMGTYANTGVPSS